MQKSTVVKTWIGGIVVLAAGLLVAGVSTGLMLAYGGTFTQSATTNGYDFVPVTDGFFWSMVGLIVIGGVLAAVGGVVQLVAWIGALVNTYQVPDKTWFAVVLGGGVLGLFVGLIGFAAMIAYVVAGPDGMALPRPHPAGPVPGALAPTA
jgi:hypothetical protein